MALSSFTPSVTGMSAQAHALETVSTNFANMRTVGYKPNETMFNTLLGSTPNFNNTVDELSSSRVNINGVSYYDRTLVNKQGTITATGNSYDVAINGENAFFEVKDSGGNIYYTRAGDFTTLTQNGRTYLVTGNGIRFRAFRPPATDLVRRRRISKSFIRKKFLRCRQPKPKWWPMFPPTGLTAAHTALPFTGRIMTAGR